MFHETGPAESHTKVRPSYQFKTILLFLVVHGIYDAKLFETATPELEVARRRLEVARGTPWAWNIAGLFR